MAIRAAQYVRMSTEHQQYSTENQADAIREFALLHGMEIVATYTDEGRSGLTFDNRPGLRRLIADVERGNPGFEMILAYDVSRWGRFQDSDESAYYEYTCRRAGIRVEYCAEQFSNDGTPVATIVKGVKRAMAGLYSRDLSEKVFRGQRRLIELGFRQGGPAGYGLRRRLIDHAGNHKCNLVRGEHKSLQTDRVILVAGPAGEVSVVKDIFARFLKGESETEIAAYLNGQGILSDLDRPWTRGAIHQILINEKYIGNNVWNRSSCKLKGKRKVNEPSAWIRADRAFDAIVDVDDFIAAANRIADRAKSFSNEAMLEALARLFHANGLLSGLIINESRDMPSSAAYASRFGSLVRAYALVGYTPEHDYRYIEINRVLRQLFPSIVSSIVEGVANAGGYCEHDPSTDLLTLNAEFTASIAISRCRTAPRSNRWVVRLDTGLRPDLHVIVRLDPSNTAPLDYYIIPGSELVGGRLRLDEANGFWLDCFRFDTLDGLHELCGRSSILQVA